MRIYRQTLANAAAEVEGKTYYKDPDHMKPLLKMEIGTITGPNVTVKIGDDAEFSTITTEEALSYINYGGYDDTV